MGDNEPAIFAAVNLALEPAVAFQAALEALGPGLSRHGLRLEPGPGGRIVHDGREVGRVVAWHPPGRIELEWRPADWQPDLRTRIEVGVQAVGGGGSRITVTHRGLDGLLGPRDLAAWFATGVAAALFGAATPAVLGDWITDRQARRPSGEDARGIYRDPLYHYPNFAVILEELALTADDRLLEVACGGGALLKEALATGCTAAGVDHSPDMVRVARETNTAAIEDGRLAVLEAAAERLPFPGAVFTAATMTGVLGFLNDPVTALREVRRVLVDGGRFVALGSDPAWRGTMAAPEPFASRLRFWDDDELEALGREAGFDSVRVVRRDLEPHARGRVPDEHVSMFAGPGAPFLLARKG